MVRQGIRAGVPEGVILTSQSPPEGALQVTGEDGEGGILLERRTEKEGLETERSGGEWFLRLEEL